MSDCACWSDSARRWSRPTTSAATASRSSPSARWRWRASRPTTNMSVSPIRRCWRATSRSRSARSARFPRPPNSSAAPAKPKRRRSRSRASPNRAARRPRRGIGGMVLVTSTGFHGSYLRSSQGISMTAIVGRRHRHGARLRLHLGAARRRSRCRPKASAARPASAPWRASNPRKVETCKVPVVFDPRVAGSLVGHLVGAVNGASIARKTSVPEGPARRAAVSRTTSASSTIRCGCAACARRRSTPRASR